MPTSHTIPRRMLLASGGGLAAGSLTGQLPSFGARPLTMAILLDRWIDVLTGRTYNTGDPDFSAPVAAVETLAQENLELLSDPGSDMVFTGLPLRADDDTAPPIVEANMAASARKIKEIATAYVTPGTAVFGDGDIADHLVHAIQVIHDVAYNTSREYDRGVPHDEFVAEWGNWYHWEIGTPVRLLDVFAMLGDKLNSQDLAIYLDAFDHFVPAIAYTGSNRMYLIREMILRGLLGENEDKVGQGRAGLDEVLVQHSRGDGFHHDGSIIQHVNVPYVGAYGTELLSNLAYVFTLIGGTPWDFPPEKRQVALDAVDRTFIPLMVSGKLMDLANGRFTDTTSNHGYGHVVMERILVMAHGVEPSRATRWRGLVKGWLERDTFDDITDGSGVSRLALVKALQEQHPDPGTPPPQMHRTFAGMGRAICRRPGWTAGLAMSSTEVARYEHDYPITDSDADPAGYNNSYGFHQGSGALYLYTADQTSYDRNYWATVDPYRLAGTTVDSQPLTAGAGGCCPTAVTHRALATNEIAGGASLDDHYGVAIQEITSIGSDMSSRSGWFFLDDFIVCLGEGVTGGSTFGLETILENRKVSADAVCTIDGSIFQLAPDEQVMQQIRWFHVDNSAGYVLLEPTDLRFKREQRHGRGRTAEFVTAWIDHGVRPESAGYGYLVAPAADMAQTEALALSHGLAQVVREPHLLGMHRHELIDQNLPALTGVAAFTAANVVIGKRMEISTSGPAALMIRMLGDDMQVSIADPTRAADELTVTIHRYPMGNWTGDATVAVARHRGQLRIQLDTSARDGRSHRLTGELS